MPAKKSATESVAAVAAAAPVKDVEKTGGATAKGAKAAATKTTKKVDTPVATPASTATAATPDVTPATDSSETKDEVSNGELIISGLLEKVGTLAGQIKVIQTSLKLLVKEFDKQKKIIDKVQKKREKAKKSPSGFAKPCKISDDLCDFIGVPKGSEQSRTDITRFINSYVKEHNLNNPQNRREFFPDKKLKAILNVKDGEKVTYFVLQRLIAHHFPPSMSKLAAAAKTA